MFAVYDTYTTVPGIIEVDAAVFAARPPSAPRLEWQPSEASRLASLGIVLDSDAGLFASQAEAQEWLDTHPAAEWKRQRQA